MACGASPMSCASASLRAQAGCSTSRRCQEATQAALSGTHCRAARQLAAGRPRRRAVAGRGRLAVRALDAAMPFDFEHRAAKRLEAANRLTVGIVGFGTFGQFLAKRLVQAGHEVIATSRSPYEAEAAALGVRYYRDADDFCERHPDVVVLATSILSLEKVLASLPVQRLRRSTLFVDVLSVKEFPKRLLLAKLPPQVDVLCTHPMFGPDSGKAAWTGLNLMYERVRVGRGEERQRRVDAFLKFFADEGCAMVEMSCEEHDRTAASTQFITHTVGRMLGEMALQPTPIDTRGYTSLLSLVDNTANDSFDLYYGLFMYNQNATQELYRLDRAFDSVKRQLFEQLHSRLRAELLHDPLKPGSGQASDHGGSGRAGAAAAGEGAGDGAARGGDTRVRRAAGASEEVRQQQEAGGGEHAPSASHSNGAS